MEQPIFFLDWKAFESIEIKCCVDINFNLQVYSNLENPWLAKKIITTKKQKEILRDVTSRHQLLTLINKL